MAEARRDVLVGLLEELCHAVAADGGAALYLDDGDGALQRVATAGAGGARAPRLLDRLRDPEDDRRTMVLSVPGTPSGVAVLSRRAGGNFTQQDRAVARLFVRRLAEGAAAAGGPLAPSIWTRQLEAIQRIGARLNRLGSIDEVAATICRGTFEVIAHDETHLLVADDRGYLRPIAQATANGGTPPTLPYDGPVAAHIDRAVAGAKPVLAHALPDAGGGRVGTRSLLLVPLLHEATVIGLLCLVAQGDRHFDDDDLRLLQVLSDQAAVAIENARLLSGRDELVHELASLLDISEAAGATSDERQLATLLATRMRRATETDGARVSRWEEGSTVLRPIGRDGVGWSDDQIELADSPLRWATLRDSRPAVIALDARDDGTETNALRAGGARTLILLPLITGGRTIGLVELLALHQSRSLSESQIHACEAMASLSATGLERVRLVEQLRSAADIDLVTGVHNHRYLQDRLRQEVARSARSHSPLAVLMMDLDKFKPVNDRHGHADGDRVLHNIGATIKGEMRTSDVVARYGGDEFVVVMPDTDVAQAELVARRVVGAITSRRHELSDGKHVSVGVSAGFAMYPVDGRTSAQLLQAADGAMYAAKRAGGRQVERSANVNTTAASEAIPARATASAG
jgi:diguanylate cyclase (GGDEF)-like protein